MTEVLVIAQNVLKNPPHKVKNEDSVIQCMRMIKIMYVLTIKYDCDIMCHGSWSMHWFENEDSVMQWWNDMILTGLVI